MEFANQLGLWTLFLFLKIQLKFFIINISILELMKNEILISSSIIFLFKGDLKNEEKINNFSFTNGCTSI